MMGRRSRPRTVLLVLLVVLAPISTMTVVGIGGDLDRTNPPLSRDMDQVRSTLWGFVEDTEGNGLTGAKVQLTPKAGSHLIRSTQSQTGGYYTIDVPAGKYDVLVQKSGYFEYSGYVELLAGDEVRNDYQLEKIPEKTSSVRGKIMNNDTGIAVAGASVTIYDIIRNYTITDTTNLLGNYNIDIYSGTFIIMVGKSGFLPKFIGGVTIQPEEIITKDIYIYPMPPLDARAIGDVTYSLNNGTTGEVPNATVALYDSEKGFYTDLTCDENGHYDLNIYEGDFLFFVNSEDHPTLDAVPRNVSLSSSQVTVENFDLPELPGTNLQAVANLTDWNSGRATLNSTSWGRGEGSTGTPVRFIRFIIDLYVGNGDLDATSEELDPFIEHLASDIKNDFGLYDTADLMLVDGVEYTFAQEAEILEIDVSGHVFGDTPMEMGLEILFEANGTIDEDLPVHHIWTNVTYDTPDQVSETTFIFPPEFTMSNLSASGNVTITETVEGTVYTSGGDDPDPEDDRRSEEVTFDMIDSLPPTAHLSGPYTTDEDVPVELNASASGDNFGIENYGWTFGDGEVTNTSTPVVEHVYEEPGNYTVNLTVTDGVGREDSTSTRVNVMDATPPEVDILVDNQTVPEDLPVVFEANATDNVGVANITWSVNGEDVGYGPVLNHTFSEPGEGTLGVKVTDTSGHMGEATVQMTILDTTPPVPVPGENRTVNEGQEVTLDGTGSHDNVGIESYTWNFGDESTNVTGEITSHKYDTPGNYTVTLRLRDRAGLENSSSIWVLVKDITPPTAEINVKKDEVVLGKKIYFEGNTSTDNVGIVEYHWDFGDGANTTGQLVSHKYRDPGTYDAVLTVIDAEGNRDNTTITVEVYEPENPFATVLCISAIFVGVFIGGIGSYLLYRRIRFGGYDIDEVFVVYRDGRLLRHISAHKSESKDKEIIASMLTAVQDFVKDSLRKEEGEFLGKLEYGKDTKILIERGEHIFLAIVLSGHDPESMRGSLCKYVNEIEDRFGGALKKWDGDIAKFDGLDEMLIGIIED